MTIKKSNATQNPKLTCPLIGNNASKHVYQTNSRRKRTEKSGTATLLVSGPPEIWVGRLRPKTSNNNEQKLHDICFGAKRSVHRKIGKSTIAQSGLTKNTSAKQSLRACSLRLAFVKHKKTACRIAKKTTKRCAYSKTTS